MVEFDQRMENSAEPGAESGAALVELTLAIGETIDIPPEEAEEIRTVRDAIDCVEKNTMQCAGSTSESAGRCA